MRNARLTQEELDAMKRKLADALKNEYDSGGLNYDTYNYLNYGVQYCDEKQLRTVEQIFHTVID